MTTLKIATYNIHKGFSHFNRRMVLHELRARLHELNADIVFLQEVQGESLKNIRRHSNYPTLPQHEFLAYQTWPYHAYGMNAVYDGGHHGNAILSRFPIMRWENQNISAHRFEERGLLHCEITLPHSSTLLHCFCIHFGLFERGRGVQLEALVRRIRGMVPTDAPLVIAGDFNDWRNRAGPLLLRELGCREVFEISHGKPARSFPVAFPCLHMDRIYVRGAGIQQGEVHAHHPWNRVSDHAALSATLTLT